MILSAACCASEGQRLVKERVGVRQGGGERGEAPLQPLQPLNQVAGHGGVVWKGDDERQVWPLPPAEVAVSAAACCPGRGEHKHLRLDQFATCICPAHIDAELNCIFSDALCCSLIAASRHVSCLHLPARHSCRRCHPGDPCTCLLLVCCSCTVTDTQCIGMFTRCKTQVSVHIHHQFSPPAALQQLPPPPLPPWPPAAPRPAPGTRGGARPPASRRASRRCRSTTPRGRRCTAQGSSEVWGRSAHAPHRHQQQQQQHASACCSRLQASAPSTLLAHLHRMLPAPCPAAGPPSPPRLAQRR